MLQNLGATDVVETYNMYMNTRKCVAAAVYGRRLMCER
jgi:hypothetical protein